MENSFTEFAKSTTNTSMDTDFKRVYDSKNTYCIMTD